ncbi:hypothetical protein LTR66_016374 [Elasticomyces elasticus]|nr:hypothetical protein LTR66_016374 [Elasticomyces elasticus]
MVNEMKELAIEAGQGLEAEDPVPDTSGKAIETERNTNTTINHQHNTSVDSGSSTASESSPTDEVAKDSDADKNELQQTTSRADGFSTLRIALIMTSLCTALFLAALDVTIITTALPTIAQHFHASSSGYTWIGSSYLLANAAATPIWGKFSDIWGRKPMLIAANIVFMIGSLVAALATSIGMLIGGRVIQGLGGGGLIILVSIAISDLFTMRDRPKYYALVGATWSIASGVGPIIGGVFTEKVSWRWCFYINLPLDGVALALLIFVLKLETPKTSLVKGLKAVDWLGGVLIVGGVIAFLYGFASAGTTHPWDSTFVLCLIIFGAVMIGLFFVVEWRFAKYPIMPPRIFAEWSNVAAYGVCFLFGFVFIAESYYLPLYFQTVMGLSPILSGVTLFALVIPLSIMAMATGIIIKKTGRYLEITWISAVFFALGAGLLIDLPANISWPRVIIFQIIAGLGTGPLLQAPLIALQAHLKGYDAAVGTATYGFLRNIATSMSVVLGGVVFQNELRKKETYLSSILGPETAARFAGSSFGATTGLLHTLPPAQRQALDEAYASSLRTMWIFYTCFAVLLIVVSAFITKKELSQTKEKGAQGLAAQERVRLEERQLKQEKAAAKAGKAEKDGSRPATAEKL